MAQRISTLVAVLSIFVVSSAAVKCPGTAKYTLTFRVTWTMANHPNTALPNSAHFSRLIGCSHNSDYIMWRRGLKATPGVKLVAERGQTGILETEIENQISAGNAWKVILPGESLGAVDEQTGIQVEVTSNFSKVSFISMLAPSPDWYVGIDSHDLCDNGKWRETWNVTFLPPYDSGTDSGLQFTSPNQVTNPPADIFRITHTMDGAFKAPNPIPSLGEFRFIGTDLPISNISEASATPTYKMTASVTPTTKYTQTTQATTTAQPDSAGRDTVSFSMFISAAFILALLF